MAIELLRDVQVRNAKAKRKPYRLHDGEGLYLWVSTTGAKAWQFRYKRDGKSQTTTFGKYPRISLAEAREKAADARTRSANGEHLTIVKRMTKLQKKTELANTFETYSAAWIAREARRMAWSSDYRIEVESSLKNHLNELYPLPMAQLSAPIVAPLLMALENKAPHMVEKVRRRLRAILDYAVEQGVIPGNPLPAARRGAKVARRHFPAVTDLMGVGAILRAARTADPCKGIQRAHLLLTFTGQRVSEVVGARWEEFQLDGAPVAVGDGHRTKHDPHAGN
jgi:site-specific recombinase XerC